MALRFGPVLVLAAGLAWALSSGVLHHLSLHDLRDSRFRLQAFVRDHPLKALGGYVLAYIAVVGFSLPGAMIMTLTGGFLFGPWLGGVTADLACSAGATVVFVVLRLATGDSLERRAHPRFKAFEAGFRKDAFLYLLTLRLIPVTPSWLVNLAAGVIGLPLGRYVAATVIGFLPVSLIYAGLGSGLGGMFDRGEHLGAQTFLSPRIVGPMLGLALLSILPIAHHWLRARGGAKTSQT
jgi:uncharacterized membrane protein YdjX (TVP38/TMEM64 family)